MRILFVCTGNACRSVMAAALARQALARRSADEFTVDSAGVRAVAGQPPDPQAVGAVAALGADASEGTARPLTRASLDGSDLILTATTAHRDHIVGLAPHRSREVFALREFARLAAHLPALPAARGEGHARAVVRAVAALRGQVPYVVSTADDIADPPRRPAAVRACALAIAEAVEACVVALVPATDTAAVPVVELST